MTWVKLDDAFPEHPKVDDISDGAFRLHVTALCWCSRWLTDGLIPEDRVPRLAPRFKPSLVKELTSGDRPLWERAEGGYQIHDYLEYQPSAEQVRAARAEAAERMRSVRAKKKPRRSAERSPEQTPNVQRTEPERSHEVRPGVRALFAHPVPQPVTTTPTPTPLPSTAPAEDGFEAFWRAYPKRNGTKDKKKDARIHWRKLTPHDRDAAARAVANYARFCEQTDTPAADAVVWLRAERWEGYLEPIAVPRPRQPFTRDAAINGPDALPIGEAVARSLNGHGLVLGLEAGPR